MATPSGSLDDKKMPDSSYRMVCLIYDYSIMLLLVMMMMMMLMMLMTMMMMMKMNGE